MKRLIELAPQTAVGSIVMPAQPKAYKLWAVYMELSCSVSTFLQLSSGIFLDSAVLPIWSVMTPLLPASNIVPVCFAAGLDSNHTAGSYETNIAGTVDQVSGVTALVMTMPNTLGVQGGLPSFVNSPSHRIQLTPRAGGTITTTQVRFFVDYVDERIDLS